MTWIHLPFVKGQDQTLDPKIAPLGVLNLALDCRIDKEGRIVKRPGYQTFGQITWVNGTIASPIQGIWSRENERVVVGGDRLYSYTNHGWRDWGLLSSVGVPERRASIRNNSSGTSDVSGAIHDPSIAVIGDLVCVVAAANGQINAIVYDANDWSIRDQASLASGSPATGNARPQVVAVGSVFVCVWVSTAASQLIFSTYDTAALTSAQWSVEAVLLPFTNRFDLAPYSATHYLLVTPTNAYSVTPAGVLSTTTAHGLTGQQLAVCGLPGEPASVAALDTVTGALTFRSWAGAGANPFAGASAGVIVHSTNLDYAAGPTLTRKSATAHTIAVSTAPIRSTGFPGQERTTWLEFTPATGATLDIVQRSGFQLASKSAYVGDTIYTWGANYSRYDRSYFLEGHTTSNDATIQTTFARSEAIDIMPVAAGTLQLEPPPSIAPITLDGQLYLLTALEFISIGSVASASPTTAVDIAQVPIGGAERYQSAEVGGCLYLAGGLLQMFDSHLAYENGFLTGPVLRAATPGSGGGGLMVPGGYQYVVTREWRDGKGQRHISQVSDPVSVTLTGGDNRVTLQISQASVNNRTPRWIAGGPAAVNPYQFYFVFHVWRTLNGGTVFYRVTGDNGLFDPTNGTSPTPPALFTYIDNAADSALAGPAGQNVVLYTQGQRGALSGPLQHDPPPPCRYIWPGKDRVIVGGLEHPDQVRWSKTFFDGEPLEFSEDLSFRKRVPGRVKAVAVLDDAWIVFTETRVYAIFGEGPDDSGVGSFAEPREIPSAVGCIDWRSVVVTPAGLMFQGRPDAIYLLPRGLGAPVEISRPVIDVLRLPGARVVASRVITAKGVAMFAIAASGSVTRHLVYDLRTGQWTMDLPYGGTTNPPVGFAEWDTLLAWCTDSEIRQEQAGFTDDALTYDLVIETHPLRPGGLQRSVRCRRVEAIGEYRGDADLTIEAAPDDAQAFTHDAIWTVDTLAPGDTFRREWRLPVQKFGSVRFRLIAESSGPGLALTGITLESETRPGTPKLGLRHRA